MKFRHRVAAVTVSLALGGSALALAAPLAQAAPVEQAARKVCKITGFSPRTVTLGVSSKKVKFKVTTSGCANKSWSIGTDSFLVTNKNPYAVLKPAQLSHREDVVVEAGNTNTEKTYINGLTLKSRAAFNTRTKAGPEPITKGKQLTVMGQLAVADWKAGGYTGYTGQTVKLQFRGHHGGFHTVKTVKTGQYGVAQTTVTAKKTGVWRMTFAGNSVSSSAKARGDYVKVKK